MCRFALILIFSTLSAHAVSIRDRLSYEPLSHLIKKYELLIRTEKGNFAQVPISPHSNKTTPLYMHWADGYKTHRPTVIYIPGGPGGSTHHNAQDLAEFSKRHDLNILAIDPRGTGLSRPEKASEYFSHEYLSTKQSAYDLESIRKQLGLTDVYLWGRSYGTMTATLAAALFPGSFKGVILEGSLSRFQDFDEHRSQHSYKIQNFLTSLPGRPSKDFHKRVETLIRSAMYDYGTLRFDDYRSVIEENKRLNDEDLLEKLQSLFPEMRSLMRIQSNPLALNLKTYERIRSIDQNLDITKYSMTTPALLLQGQDDPVCFREGALRLFESFDYTKTNFIEFEKAGHHLVGLQVYTHQVDLALTHFLKGNLNVPNKMLVPLEKTSSLDEFNSKISQCHQTFK